MCDSVRSYEEEGEHSSHRLPESSFTPWMWKLGEDERKCLRDKCMSRVRGMWKCVQCKEILPKSEFSAWLAGRRTQQRQITSRCNTCTEEQAEDAKAVARRSTA